MKCAGQEIVYSKKQSRQRSCSDGIEKVPWTAPMLQQMGPKCFALGSSFCPINQWGGGISREAVSSEDDGVAASTYVIFSTLFLAVSEG